VRQIINKIIAVEGLDKTGKSTFVDTFVTEYTRMFNTDIDPIFKYSFPNINSPIGKTIRDELASLDPNPDIVNSPNFLAEMAHYWMEELYNIHFNNITDGAEQKNNINKKQRVTTRNYIFDRYFISTLAYQAFYNDSKTDLEFIKTVLNTNKFVKIPTDIIFLDLPNAIIIERTEADRLEGNVDSNDTIDEDILDKRREAYISAFRFLKGVDLNVHWFEDVSLFTAEDLAKVLMGKIFQ
jgi:thymidylate kinase